MENKNSLKGGPNIINETQKDDIIELNTKMEIINNTLKQLNELIEKQVYEINEKIKEINPKETLEK